jgi:DNA-binding LacI/PurR family transcriptional regulator
MEEHIMGIKDIAKRVGVSPSTVSRVVNSGDTSAASRETQERIWDAVRSEGYVPNQSARNLRRPQTSMPQRLREIDCVYARISGPMINPFFTTLMHTAEVEALNQGYNLRYQYAISDLDGGAFIHPRSNLDAAIVLGRVNAESIELLQHYYKHLVFTSLQEYDFPVDQVLSSGYRAAADCVHYLYSLGHRSICYLGETEKEQRYLGYVDTMTALHIPHDEQPVAESAFTHQGGYEAVNQLLERRQRFTAILCADDMLAVGALKALRQRKLHVPRDVSLVGINDMETVRYLDPMLTTVNIPLEEMGKYSAKLLIDRIEGGHRLPAKLTLPNTLIYRESCAPPAAT